MLKSDGFTIIFNCDREIWINADKNMIDRSFYNLISNAVNYSGERKEIVINQHIKRNAVRVEVTDFGKGIAEDIKPYIWERYYKDNNSRTNSVKGSGLGLSIVKTFVESHGGICGVKSKENQGSTFWFEIPL